MIHASGIISTMFPADGGQVRTERLDYIQGNVSNYNLKKLNVIKKIC